MKRFFCCLLAAVFAFLTASCGKTSTEPEARTNADREPQPTYTAFPGSLKKREAVFVSLGADGSVQSVSVTDRLLTDVPQVQVHDVSILQNIQNIKGQETPIRDGVELTWHMQSTQLYYSGVTDKTLPVSLSIRYTLDGQETDLASLQGKAGTVCVRVSAVNQTTGNAFVPFLLVGGLILGDDATQITVENGGSLGDGSRDVAFGVMLPGLSDALGLQAQAQLLPERFSITYQTTRCALDGLYLAMVPLSTAKLSEALESLFGAAEIPQIDFSPLASQIRTVAQDRSLANLLQQSADSQEMLYAAQHAMQGYARAQPLLDVLQRYLTAENAALLQETIDSLSGTSLQEYATLLQNPMFIALMADMTTVSAAFSKLIPTLSAMIRDLQSDDVRSAIAALPDTMEHLQALSALLQKNQAWLNALSEFSQGGGLSKFSTLMQSVQTMLDSGALDTLQALSGRAGELETRLSAVLDAGKEYGIFTSAPQDADTSVYFIFKVAGRT